jgi:hypothetical protein
MNRYKLHRILLLSALVLTILSSSYCFAQTRNIIWYTPSTDATINGIGIGPTNSGNIEGKPIRQTINGIQLELVGKGAFSFPMKTPEASFMEGARSEQKCITVNGLLLSATGSVGVDKLNGISISAFFGSTGKVTGASINPINMVNSIDGAQLGIVNEAISGNGLQLGLVNSVGGFSGVQIGLININKTASCLQIGLININKDRVLPFVNF